MIPKFLRKAEKGDPITAAMWNALVEAIQRADITVGGTSGLEIQQGPTGSTMRVVDRQGRMLCVADGAITARSGSTAGTGNVLLVTLSGTTLTTTSISYPVYNPSGTTMTGGDGIADGQYCLIEEYPSGRWLVTPLECD